jgi:hypothetical protein
VTVDDADTGGDLAGAQRQRRLDVGIEGSAGAGVRGRADQQEQQRKYGGIPEGNLQANAGSARRSMPARTLHVAVSFS